MARGRFAFRLALVAAAATVAVACGGDDTSGSANNGNGGETQQPAGPPQQPESLVAAVGANDDFVISLTDEKGNDIINLAAGKYDVAFRDQSGIHNFHLTGGDLNEQTSVSEKAERTATITFAPGQYKFVCDPHAQNMSGSFTVT
jgi:hypothetical protein